MPVPSKVIALEDVPALIPPDATVAIGGAWFANHPMAAVREIVRAGRDDIHALALLGSVDVDLLIGAGALAHLTFSMVTLEAMGLSLHLRRAVQSQELPITEISALSLQVALEAGGRSVAFLPIRGPRGSDLVAMHPDVYGTARSSFDEEEVMVVRAINPDVAIVHALRCDERGNAQSDGTFGQDPELAKASTTVIVTCEEVVSTDEIVANAHMTTIPGFLVDAVVPVPFGAHPCSHVPRYALDAWEILDYQKTVMAGEDAFADYLDRLRSESEDEYRARVLEGGRARVLSSLVDVAPVLSPER
jgi:glutaconate CoA-transferase subunit A